MNDLAPSSQAEANIFKRLDELNEFERQPVSEDRLLSGSYFAAVSAGEHIAATEFVIGALFVGFGATAFDVLVGLLLGNLFAVLSWALICTPIAVQTRLTLYWYLRKIAGPAVMVTYNLMNGLLHCILAGAMITVSASAVRIPFGIPAETKWYPTHASYVVLVICVGAVVVTLAIWGFKRVAQFSSLCSPWMVAMFIAGGIAALPNLGDVNSFADFWKIANEQIWAASPAAGGSEIGFWHVVAFAWICNLAAHVGLSDMALFRYARRSSYGFYSACGMYLGHYLSWICAGIMGAAAAKLMQRPLTEIDSGGIAYLALGAVGALTVVIAGWTTANPTLYRAGLALQIATPGWPRWIVTLGAGVLTTAVACFPFVFTKLLGFVALYGLMLMPVGAIVVVEHWIFPRIGFTQFWSLRKGQILNWPALSSWMIGLAVGGGLYFTGTLHMFFLAVPIWALTAALYIALSAIAGARDELPALPPAAEPSHRSKAASPEVGAVRGVPYYVVGAIAGLCLLACALLPVLVFIGAMTSCLLNSLLIAITGLYFVSGIVWMRLRQNAAVDQP